MWLILRVLIPILSYHDEAVLSLLLLDFKFSYFGFSLHSFLCLSFLFRMLVGLPLHSLLPRGIGAMRWTWEAWKDCLKGVLL